MAQPSPGAPDLGVEASVPPTDVDEVLLQEQLTRERTRLFMTGQRAGALSGTLTPAYLAWLVWPEVPPRELLTWLIGVVLAAVVSGGHAWAYLSRPRSLPGIQAWRRRQVLLQAVIGALWGSVASWMTISPRVFVDVAVVTAFAFSIGVSSGKSSLLNALAGREMFRTDVRAGTTLARNEVPWPGVESTHSRPPWAST